MTDFNPTNFTAQELDSMNLVGVLTGKTQKGKQRVKQWGARGKVMRVWDSIPALPNKKGLFFNVACGDVTSRWVELGNDKDFDLVVTPWADDPHFLTARTHTSTDGE